MTRKTCLLLILAITAYRLTLLNFDSTDLFVDEAQYWLWSQHLDFGYYSKPPMIAWVIWLFTAIGGSDTIFWVRAASPLLHMTTALLLIPATTRLTGSEVAGYWVGASYATLPAVALSSVFMSTDTVLFPFLALSLLAYSHLIERRSLPFALILGIAIGCGTLSKYAMLYFPLTAAVAALALPRARLTLRDAAVAAVSAVCVMAPNIWWNATHGAATIKHTSDNAQWNGFQLHFGKAAEFFVSQFGVVGPVVFAAMILALIALIRRRGTGTEAHLAILSWPIVIAITLQALMSRAYANWAATAYAAGTMLAVVYLLKANPRALKASLWINSVASIAFPLLTVFVSEVVLPNGQPVLARYLGRAELSLLIAQTARDSGTTVIVADSRDILADLFHTLRDEDFIIRSLKHQAEPRSYYQQEFPLTAETSQAPVLYVTEQPPTCPSGTVQPVRDLKQDKGFRAGGPLSAYIVDPQCLLTAN